MHSTFSTLDWVLFCSYFALLGISSFMFSRAKISSSRDYFLSPKAMPVFAVALSVLATSQSAATFLGAPEYSYKGDFTFIGFYFSALVAAVFISYVLLPKFYAIKALTVYELLEHRYGERAKKQAGMMFLLGRIMASGARLYIGALAISMILFSDIAFLHVALSVVILVLGALAYAYFGGVRAIILGDVIQAVTYISAAIAVFVYLYYSLEHIDIVNTLEQNGKLKFLDFSLDGGFSVISLISGWLLLNIAAFGLDQDMTQRLLTCKDKKEAARSLLVSVALTVPVVLLFLSIGALLYLFYLNAPIAQSFEGEKVTVFMYYILNEMPEGLRGLVTVGAIAAALSSTNSVLGAMASVAVEDIYKPWKRKRGEFEEGHFVKASRVSVVLFGIALSAMAMASYFWQQHYGLSLISFALGVMTFAYTGLLGVYFCAIFTTRGNQRSVAWALIGGFVTTLLLQPYTLGLHVGFAHQMSIATAAAFLIAVLGAKDE